MYFLHPRPRRDGRTNGPAILRRASTTPFNHNNSNNHANVNSAAAPSDNHPPATDAPPSNSASFFPHESSANTANTASSARYSRDDLLSLADAPPPPGLDITSLLMPGFHPGGYANGSSSRGWGKSHDTNGTNDPTICWDVDGNSGSLGLQPMTAEEEEVRSVDLLCSPPQTRDTAQRPSVLANMLPQAFSTDVNSPLKQPQQSQQSRDAGQGPALNGRKQSLTQVLSPGGSRPGPRRRETTDTNPFSASVASPTTTGSRPFEGGNWLGGRRNVETKEPDALEEEKHEPAAQDHPVKPTGFPSLARTTTTGATGFPGNSSWSAATITPTPAFGGFGHFALNSPGVTDKGFGSTTGGSRFFSSKPDTEPAATSANPTTEANSSWRPRPRTDTDPFNGGEAPGLSGSAALGGARDTSPPPMPTTHGSQIFDTPATGTTSDFGMSGLNLGGSRVASPSQTNPYRSPPAADRGDNDREDLGFDRSHVLGGPPEQNSNFGSMRSFPAFDGSDRSQTSSVAFGTKNYPPLGNLGGWPFSTPDRERAGYNNPFGNSVFSPIGNEMQSPGLGSALGSGAGSVRGTSKLNSLFPPAMQAQMSNSEHDPLADSVPDTFRTNPLSAVGAGPIGAQSRDTSSPMSMGRGGMNLAGVFPPQPPVNASGLFSTAERNHGLMSTDLQGHDFGASTQGPPFGTEQVATGQPQTHARTMVMPDRIHWRYLDPQGVAQGPFTGLQMNDWYKSNFFSNDLRVRKEEETEFELLGQLIRRIGNSREPFLVPQVGVPHGPPSQAGSFPTGGDARGVVPPLLGVVPSYGKTLSAEEQNALERRKQEDQLAQARQREYMAQQPHFRGIHPSVSGGLQHQASMHSLQSQPSFGSITSPIGLPTQGTIGGAIGGGPAGFFDQASALNRGPSMPNAMNAGLEHHRGDYNELERQLMASVHGPGGASGMFPPQPVGPPSTTLKNQLPAANQLERDSQGHKDRLKEFHELQGIGNQQRPDEEFRTGPSQAGLAQEQAEAAKRYDAIQEMQDRESVRQQHQHPSSAQPQPAQQYQDLSLTEQVQKAQAANRQHDDPWARQVSATGLPMPFPAPVTSSAMPIAAPTAQRRTNLADQYNETRSQSQTPDSNQPDSASAQPPPLAPWARDPGTESQKQPKLRDIQEAEARVRAKQEAERRAAQELEAVAAKEREKSNPVVPGLPMNSTWGSGSPAPSAPTPWAKPSGAKLGAVGVVPSATGTTTPSKKTLAEIQKEEEARKRRENKEQAAQLGAAVAVSNLGKRYADLASKSGPPTLAGGVAAAAAGANVAAGWSTVGAGGKVKTPTGPQAMTRVASGAARAPVAPALQQQARSVAPAVNKANAVPDAKLSLQKWLRGMLVKGLKATHETDGILNLLNNVDGDKELIESILYDCLAPTSSISPVNLTEEYLRRRKDAEKGIFNPPTEPKAAAGADWSEVAKKSGNNQSQAKDDVSGGFIKVVNRGKKQKK